MSSRTAGLHSETLSQKRQNKKEKQGLGWGTVRHSSEKGRGRAGMQMAVKIGERHVCEGEAGAGMASKRWPESKGGKDNMAWACLL